MNNKILYTESQRFKQWWIWALIVGICTFVGVPIYQQAKVNISMEIIFPLIIILLVVLLFLSLRLETLIKEDGIYVRFFPFIIKYKRYDWDSIEQLYVRKYNPIAEYGGWGMRFGIFGKGMAYNVSGNIGLQIIFTNGKKLLIGTQQPKKMEAVLNELGKIKS